MRFAAMRLTPISQITEMTGTLPKGSPAALRASFESLLTASFISNRPQTVIRPALAMSGLSYKEVFTKICSRSGSPDERLLGQVVATWADSALGKGVHGRGAGASCSSIGAAAMAALRGGDQHEQEGSADDDVTLTTWLVSKSSK